MHHFKLFKSIQLGFAVAIAVAGFLFIGTKIVQFRHIDAFHNGFDLHILWIAGKLWAAGQNPYGEAFTSAYRTEFGAVPDMHFMLYPPYWAPIAVPLGFLSFGTACVVWRVLNLALLIWATALTSHVVTGKIPGRFWIIFLLGVGYVTLMHATSFVFWIGQTSVLPYFGLAAIFYGLNKRRRWALVVGLIAVALKPNVGAVIYLVIAMMPRWRASLTLAAALLIVCAAPVMLDAPYQTLSGMLTNFGNYYGVNLAANSPNGLVANDWVRIQNGDWAQFIVNAPANMVGVFHLTGSLPNRATANALIAAAAVASLFLFRQEGSDELKFVRVILVILLLVPLHAYDIIMVMIPAMFIWSQRMADGRTLAALLGILICFRPSIIAQLLHIAPDVEFRESGPATVGLFLIAVPLLIPAKLQRGTGRSTGLLLENDHPETSLG